VRFFTDERPLVEPNIKSVFKGKGERSWSPPWKMPDSHEDMKRGIGIQPHSVVSKCTFCYHRISKAPKGTPDLDPSNPALREFTPACVVTCAPTARYFGDLDNPESEVSKLIAKKRGTRLLDHLGNKPQVYYVTGTSSSIPGSRASRKKTS
jgi:molybdopterin-containing oxidoreductase family iron-sulfur binding subunit